MFQERALSYMDKALNPCVWIHQAKIELDVAIHLEQVFMPKPLEIICFHAQQAAEKSIKAVLLHQQSNTHIEKTHDLSILLDKINQEQIPFDDIFYEYADKLFPYSVATRYPNQLQDDIDEYRTKNAISYATEIYEWAKTTIVASNE